MCYPHTATQKPLVDSKKIDLTLDPYTDSSSIANDRIEQTRYNGPLIPRVVIKKDNTHED